MSAGVKLSNSRSPLETALDVEYNGDKKNAHSLPIGHWTKVLSHNRSRKILMQSRIHYSILDTD